MTKRLCCGHYLLFFCMRFSSEQVMECAKNELLATSAARRLWLRLWLISTISLPVPCDQDTSFDQALVVAMHKDDHANTTNKDDHADTTNSYGAHRCAVLHDELQKLVAKPSRFTPCTYRYGIIGRKSWALKSPTVPQ